MQVLLIVLVHSLLRLRPVDVGPGRPLHVLAAFAQPHVPIEQFLVLPVMLHKPHGIPAINGSLLGVKDLRVKRGPSAGQHLVLSRVAGDLLQVARPSATRMRVAALAAFHLGCMLQIFSTAIAGMI